MQIIPVLDILDGIVVRGVAGERHRYQRVQSVLTPSCDPSLLIRLMQSEFAVDTFYIADLNAIQYSRPNHCTLAELAQSETRLMMDCGVRCQADIEWLDDLAADQVILGLETLPSMTLIRQAVDLLGTERTVLSLDLKHGQPLTGIDEWQQLSAGQIVAQAIQQGCTRFIVLDLANVGTGQGVSTLKLCADIRRQLPSATIITGGGVSDINDLYRLNDAEVDGVLLASALHDGRITASDLASLHETQQ